jgi:hypothetical protein
MRTHTTTGLLSTLLFLFIIGCSSDEPADAETNLATTQEPVELVQFPEFEPQLVGCWYPEVPLDNDANCLRLATADALCLPVKDNVCRRACSFISPYLRGDASRHIAGCVEQTACGYTSQGQVVVECLDMAITMGELPATPGSADACSTVGDRLMECGLDRADFDINCRAFARAFTGDSVSRIANCAASSCDEVESCVGQSNCTMGNLTAYHPGEVQR